MEVLVVDRDFWRGRRVYLTGHTGFKGAWLALWLQDMGAELTGRALAPSTQPNLFELSGLGENFATLGDVADRDAVREDVAAAQPEIVLHLAAQALVQASYDDPFETFRTNVLGVAAVLDAARGSPSVKAVISVTSDKCYENREWAWGYREADRLGGRDPYSASKAGAEIVAAAMRSSFFGPGRHPALTASVRAGNVIGGGDWSEHRIVPDIIRGCLAGDGAVILRNPNSVRPWQHVLEPIGAYLGLAQRLHAGEAQLATAFNFGPAESDAGTVRELAEALVSRLGRGRIIVAEEDSPRHEAALLRLDCSRARQELGWEPRLHIKDAIAWTADWYLAWSRGEDIRALTLAQIAEFERLGPR